MQPRFARVDVASYSFPMEKYNYRRFVLPEIIFGAGALGLAGRYARGFDAKRALLVSDPGVAAAGWTKAVQSVLADSGVECLTFLGVSPNPRETEVGRGIEALRDADCDLVVAVGGGSPLDCAKGIAICATNGGSILDYEGVDKVPFPGLPLICIPTTAGTSADISQFAIINDSSRRVKIAIISKKTVPDAALIDHRTTTTMAPELTAATGMDALCHAAEAYVSLGSSALTDLPALEATRLIGRYLPEAFRAAQAGCGPDPELGIDARPDCEDSEEARRGMMLASLLAGQAFSNASLGIVHAMAHALGGLLDAPHGLCNAILLDRAALANADSADLRYAKLAAALSRGREEAEGGRSEEPERGKRLEAGQGARAFAEEVRRLRELLGLATRLSDLGVSAADIPRLAQFAVRDPCLATNPKKLGVDDIRRVYEQAL